MTAIEIEEPTKLSAFANSIYEQKYALKDEFGNVLEKWEDTAYRVSTNVMGALGYKEDHEIVQEITDLIKQRKFLPGGRYLYSAGRELHQTQNCVLLRAEDSREGWAELLHNSAQALMTGAGIGIEYSDIRPKGSIIKKTGGEASGPISLMQMINECGRHIMQGGSRRSAIWAGLRWSHRDCESFIRAKDWPQWLRDKKDEDFNTPAPLDMTNISVVLDKDFFDAYEDETNLQHELAHKIYWLTVGKMVSTGEPGFSVDYDNPRESLRNACTEITSEDDSDICNLGSINLARIESPEEMERVVELGSLFLLAGTVYSHVPYEKVSETRSKNRRLGLGIMGVHEWLLMRGFKYEPNDELASWLDIYARSGEFANRWADIHNLSHPIKSRAIAPTGTIGIVGETTTGIELIFCVAYKRRYLVGGTVWKYQYVIDPTARRIIEKYGVDPSEIQDAYMLSYDIEKRFAFQAWVQQWVDHGISSTANLPYPITEENEVRDFGETLLPYLPKLRGMTCYPDGARGGQPLVPSTYEIAIEQEGVVFEENEERCVGGLCGT